MIIAAGKFRLIEPEKDAAGHGFFEKPVSFRFRSIAPKYAVRLA
jgi:hypothetical protein